MPYNTSRRARERRLRAHYRRKIWTVGIIVLIIGLVLGFVACVYSVKNVDRVAQLLKLETVKAPSAEADPLATPHPLESGDAAFVDAAEEAAFLDAFADEDNNDALTEVPAAVENNEVVVAPTLAVVEITEAAMEEATPEPVAAEPEATAISIMVPENIVIATAAPVIEEVPAVEAPVEEAPVEPVIEEVVEATEEPVVTEAPTAEPTAEPTPEPTAEPTPEPTAEPTPEPTPEPVVEPVIIAYGESASFQTEILSDGSARRSADDAAFETLDITMQVKAYKDPAYFEANYADKYNLQGNEAAVEFEITLNGYEGAAEIIPQNFLLITFRGEDETVTSQGFQLMDTEIAGKTEIAITSDTTATLYKRYPYNADQGDMTYMVVNSYVDGVEYTHMFEIIAPETEDAAAAATEAAAEETAAEAGAMTVGSKGDDVKRLQAKLIELGLLSGQPDGHFGNYTAAAVKEMQRRYGMEQTGIADQAFMNRLFG